MDAACDVVVVGGGMSGLSAGAFLARAGRRVVVVEAEGRPGGYARAIHSGGYRVDPAVHLVMGGNREGPHGPGLIAEALDVLGVSDLCEFLPVDPFYTAVFPGMSLTVPTGRQAFIDAHVEQFPSEERGLTRLVETCSRMYKGMLSLPVVPRPTDLLGLAVRAPTMVRFRNSTVEHSVGRYLTDPKLRAAYSALAGYVGLPPSRASFAIWATMMAAYVEEGAFYCRGGFQSLADAFANGLQHHGGELQLGTEVAGVAVEDGRVAGVELADGRRISAPIIVSTVDARKTFGTLIDDSALPPPWMQRIRETEVSVAVHGLYLGTDLDLSQSRVSQESIVYRTWDIEDSFRHPSDGRVRGVSVTIPTLADPSLAPEGRHQVNILGVADPDPERADAGAVAESFLELAEEVLPGLRQHIVFAHGNGPGRPDPADLPLHRIDAIYGWAHTPENSGPNRLPQRTPIDGLFLAGHWTQPAHGIETVIGSGIRAARLVLGEGTSRSLRPLTR